MYVRQGCSTSGLRKDFRSNFWNFIILKNLHYTLYSVLKKYVANNLYFLYIYGGRSGPWTKELSIPYVRCTSSFVHAKQFCSSMVLPLHSEFKKADRRTHQTFIAWVSLVELNYIGRAYYNIKKYFPKCSGINKFTWNLIRKENIVKAT